MSACASRVQGWRAVLRLVALSVLCSSVGCGAAKKVETAARNSAERDQVKSTLQAFVKLYHNFHDSNRRGPADAKELEPLAALSGGAPVLQSLQQLGCEVAWGTNFSGLPMGTHEYILAHRPRDLQDDGGYVLFLSGSVEFLPADQIRQKLEQREKARSPRPTPAPAKPAAPGAAKSGLTTP
jgi:hypothetical protein